MRGPTSDSEKSSINNCCILGEKQSKNSLLLDAQHVTVKANAVLVSVMFKLINSIIGYYFLHAYEWKVFIVIYKLRSLLLLAVGFLISLVSMNVCTNR